MGSGGSNQSPDNRVNVFRLKLLIIDGGLLVFRNIVDKTLAVKSKTLSECLYNERSTIDALKRKRILNQVQYDILFPIGKNPTTTDMDITLLMFLLKNLDSFPSIDAADINRLRIYQNQLSHMASTTEIQEQKFKKMWTDIEQILVRHSTPDLNIQKIIAGYMTCPLDHEREKMLQKEIEKWNELGDNHKQTKEEKYQSRKADLKDSLITFYRTRHSHIFLSPLFEEKDTPLASFYIRPELSSIGSFDVERPLKSLSEMFKTEKREIYVLADAGLGKTVFSKYLANVWCQAHYPDKNLKLFSKDDIDCMEEFDFIFLVLLREAGDLCSIDELIFDKIVLELGVEETLSKNDLLKILKNEKCLVILDGLDEWTHPDKKCKRSPKQSIHNRNDPSIPHRNDREKCTVLTTTRPWKLGVLKLNSYQLGKKVELTALSSNSADTLIERTIQELKSPRNKNALDSDVREFKETIKKRQNVELAFVPLLLIYTICLWCAGFDIGNSKCDLYKKIVEFLLLRTIEINEGIHEELKQKQSRKLSSSGLLFVSSFEEYDKCKQNIPLLMHIGKLAYYTLFNETKENTLVFDGSIARNYLSTEEMKFTLATGMLSESTSNAPYKKISKVSYSHKTVHEFFAAIFLSFQSDAQKIVLDKCKSIQDILDMSKVFEFISGLNADRMWVISHGLMSVINEDEKTRFYRTRTVQEDWIHNPLYNIQQMFMSCLQEIPASDIQLCLQDFFIVGDTKHSEKLQHLLKQNKTNIKSLHIDIAYTSSSLREILDLFSLTDLSHIQKLYYRGDWKKEAEICRILFPSLQYVCLKFGEFTNDEENLIENIARLENLKYLYINNFKLSHKILEAFCNYISGQKSMKELSLISLDCKEHGGHDCKRWNLDLSHHSALSKLDLRALPWWLQLNISTPSLVDVTLLRINLDESSLLLSHDKLGIKSVVLKRIKMSAGSLHNFITVLENLPQSVRVDMEDIEPKTEYESVSENIWRRSQSFHVIHGESSCQSFVFKTTKPSNE